MSTDKAIIEDLNTIEGWFIVTGRVHTIKHETNYIVCDKIHARCHRDV